MKKETVKFFTESKGFGLILAGLARFQITDNIISHGSGDYVANEIDY